MPTIREEIFQENMEKYGCGYHSVCKEHDCSCRLDAETELDENTWDKLANQW